MREVLRQLDQAWARTDALFGMLDQQALYDHGIPLRHPFVFYIGHLPAFAWNHLAAVTGAGPFEARLDDLFARGIDPEDAGGAATHAHQGWPEIERVIDYRDRIRAAIPELASRLEGLDDPLAGWVLPMVLEHEQMHHETLLYMLSRMQPSRVRRPGGWSGARLGSGGEPAEALQVEAGEVRLGEERSALPFGWDNEFPSAVQWVPGFRLDRTSVTVGEWAAFMDAGGYRDRALWTDPDWQWRQAAGVEHPDNWRPGWQVRSLFEWHDLDEVSAWPVQVSLAEARAWCRSRGGRRLPTEAELHRAAFCTPDGSRVGFEPAADAPCDFRVHSSVPVGSAGTPGPWGHRDLIGNGWEWTSTPFLPRPGFEAHLRTYPGYSADFFDNKHFVVFGASWATDRRLIRPSFRNWYQHHYPYVFSAFRTVRTASAAL